MGGKVRKAAVREDSMNHCKLIVTALALIGVLHTGNARAEIKT